MFEIIEKEEEEEEEEEEEREKKKNLYVYIYVDLFDTIRTHGDKEKTLSGFKSS